MSTPDFLLKVAVPVPLRRFFYYQPEKHSGPDDYQPGIRLEVPFGNRRLTGILIEVMPNQTAEDLVLKPITCKLDRENLLPADILQLGLWAASYYQHPPGEVLSAILPPMLRAPRTTEVTREHWWRIADHPRRPELPAQAFRQKQLLTFLAERPEGTAEAEIKAAGFTRAQLQGLANRSLIEEQTAPENRYQAAAMPEMASPPTANTEQQTALAAILEDIEGFRCTLLQGITGSGKTEVYLQAIAHCLKSGRRALVLLPEIALTPQILKRFRHRFGKGVVALHSQVPGARRLRIWQDARQGKASIIIGTRMAVFTPIPNLGIIVVDEEHDPSLRQQDGFCYSARDLAVKRAHAAGIPIILGSATPSLETLMNVQEGRYRQVQLTRRAGAASVPRFQMLDTRQKHLENGFTQALLKEIQQHIAAGNQVLVYLNRRGFAPALVCYHCGWIANCPHCDARLTYHLASQRLDCHHCGYWQAHTSACAECGTERISPRGQGTERIAQTLTGLFPDTPVIRVDSDTTSRRNALESLLNQIDESRACLMVGTQMLAKGHHFPRVTLVAILDGDNALFSADYRGIERMAQLLIQVAGRAGRASQPGKVLLQTSQPDHPVLQTLIHQGYGAFAKMALEERRQGELPPWSQHAVLRADAPAAEAASAYLQHLLPLANDALKNHPSGIITLMGPYIPGMEKRNRRYRCHLLFQSKNRRVLQQYLADLCQQLEQIPRRNQVRWSLEVDPCQYL